jgi:diguanylate cyclase (GGDEF)-like protein
MPNSDQEAISHRKLLTEKTLSEQLRLSDREIEERKILLGLDQEKIQLLLACKPVILRHLDRIADEFYQRQMAIPEIELLIGDAETFKRLHASMRRYITELFEGYYDREYVNKRLRIGKVHKRIGVSPKLYISAVLLLEEILQRHITKQLGGDGKCDECISHREALHTLLMFDIQLVFDTYINSLITEVDSAKYEVEKYAASLEATVAERTRQLEELSRKDALTGLYNQRSFYEILRTTLSQAEANGELVSVVYFDLNNFKQLNDAQGHQAGDNLLTLIGHTVQECIREPDIACRYGGDEFTIIMPRTGSKEAQAICERIAEAFQQSDNRGVSLSIGIGQAGPQSYPGMDELVRLADNAMYDSKAQSKKQPGDFITLARQDN